MADLPDPFSPMTKLTPAQKSISSEAWHMKFVSASFSMLPASEYVVSLSLCVCVCVPNCDMVAAPPRLAAAACARRAGRSRARAFFARL
jgi:hypothetical protein